MSAAQPTGPERLAAEVALAQRLGERAWHDLTGPQQECYVREELAQRARLATIAETPAPSCVGDVTRTPPLPPVLDVSDDATRAAVARMLIHWHGRPLRQLHALLQMGAPDELRGALCVDKALGLQLEGAADPLGPTTAGEYAQAAALAAWDAIGRTMPPEKRTKK